MNKTELAIWKVVRDADQKFTKDSASSTKTWVRDYFLPALEEHGIKLIIPDQDDEGAK